MKRRQYLATALTTLTTGALAGCSGGGGGGNGTSGGGGGQTGTRGQTGQPTEANAPAATPAGTTVGAGTAGTGTATEPTTGSAAQAIRLGGKVAGWQGRAPPAIQGETNPTLTLQPGTTYRLTWVNLDGAEHELIIEDRNGTELAATESASKQGATRSVTFTATKNMAQYYCEYHPQSMRGNIRFASEMATTGTETSGGGATTGSGSGY